MKIKEFTMRGRELYAVCHGMVPLRVSQNENKKCARSLYSLVPAVGFEPTTP